MKILWLCNIILPEVANAIGSGHSAFGGWITGLANSLTEQQNIKLIVCSPVDNTEKMLCGESGKLRYYCFPTFGPTTDKNIGKYEKCFEKILNDEQPDIIHIFGTEYIHTLAMVNVCERLNLTNQTVIQIQGLLLPCSRHYCSGLPYRVIHSCRTIHDLRRLDSVARQKKLFEKRGEYEAQALRKVKHIIGRTDFDKAYTLQVNPTAKYHFCNESLRNAFYENSWDINRCEKHSIFVSQCNYPIKGFHFLLEAMPEILKKYPDAHIYTTGNDLTNRSFLQKHTDTTYRLYLDNLIKKYNLQNNITFLGTLDEQKMCERFCRSHLFVSPSAIENSPNSLGEAMLLGVPAVTSDVGGVKNMLTHENEGFVYQHDAPYMLAHYVCEIFSNDQLAAKFSENEKLHASKTHNRKTNCNTVMEIYNSMIK